MRVILLILLSIIINFNSSAIPNDSIPKHIVAYITSWSTEIPDPNYMTHLNYAFGHVNDTFDGIKIDNPARFHRISRLKRINPELKILLSIGGWGSGRFSEMASDPSLRSAFAKDCRRIVDEYGIDGIDVDWEYPGSNIAGISSSENDNVNFVLLLKEIRENLGDKHLLTIASAASAAGYLFHDFLPYIDLAYDMAQAPQLHSALHKSPLSGDMTASAAVNAHITAGVPPSKLILGIPFYGRGRHPYDNFVDYGKIKLASGCSEQWDSIAMVPYIADKSGKVVLSYDNPESIRIKCDFIKAAGLKGAMYWDYSGDNGDSELRKAIKRNINPDDTTDIYPANYAKAPRFKALLYYSDKAEPAHVTFARQAIDFFHRLTYGEGYILDKTTSLSEYSYDRLKDYNLIIAINTSPIEKSERKAFEKYMENGGGWIGFHAAGYNDQNTGWGWFNKFLGAGKFYCNNWPPQPALVDIELNNHPVTKNLPSSFVAPECEWYQWNHNPRLNPDVEILLSLSDRNYPLGIKDVVRSGDFPIVWTNTKYRMIYLNIGHGDREFTDATQNLLIVNAFRWIASTDPAGDPFTK